MILGSYIGETDDKYKVVIDAIYTLGRAVEGRLGVKRERGED